MPAENLAAKTIERVGAGTVVAPGGTTNFIEGALRLMGDDELRRTMGKRARAYAEGAFGGEAIAEQFEAVLQQAVDPAGTGSESYDLVGRS
jgi:glycosyltransferase involved in cell wall biosynthesis